jgi:hypothetical protein
MLQRRKEAYRALALLLAVGAVALLLAPTPIAARSDSVTPAAGPPAPGSVGASVTWNNVDVSSHASRGSAVGTTFGGLVDVKFTWKSVGAIPSRLTAFNISTARLQLIYFGLPLTTRDEVNSSPIADTGGTFDMQWDPGILRYLAEGSFAMMASLIAPNGTTLWSEQFFIHATAPFAVLAILPLLLILIVVWELYSLATVGRASAPSPWQQRLAPPPAEPVKPWSDATVPEAGPSAEDRGP